MGARGGFMSDVGIDDDWIPEVLENVVRETSVLFVTT
jgi:uncharacterized membrane protein